MESLMDSLMKDRHFIDGELLNIQNQMERLTVQREILLYKRRLTLEAIARLHEMEEMTDAA